jgi:hypothetical protein
LSSSHAAAQYASARAWVAWSQVLNSAKARRDEGEESKESEVQVELIMMGKTGDMIECDQSEGSDNNNNKKSKRLREEG